MKTITALVLALSIHMLNTSNAMADEIMLPGDTAWARATPPGTTTSAIYLTLMNRSPSDISLSAATTEVTDRVELHTHAHQNGVMKMQQVSELKIPANGQAQLKPHGDHIMLFNLASPLKAGETISVELNFTNGVTKTLEIPVLKNPPMSDTKTEQHQHKKDTSTAHQHSHDKSDS